MNARLEYASEGVDEKLSIESIAKFGVPLIKFHELKITAERQNFGNKQRNEIQLGFCLYSNQTFPPTLLSTTIFPNTIQVFNNFDEIPGSSFILIIFFVFLILLLQC